MSRTALPPTFTDTRIERKEWRFVLLVSLGLLILTSLPYVFAALTTPSDRQFMGFILNISDHAQYLSWYKAFQTDLLTSNRLTPEVNPVIFFNLLWWLLAQIGRFTGLSYPWVYQILRWASGFAFLLTAYWFIARFFSEAARRKIVFLLLTLGSGLGWVLVVLKYSLLKGELVFPLDLYVAEGNTFLCLMAYPHFLEAAAFILAVFALLLTGERTGRLRSAVWAGVVAFLLGWQHGYDLIIVWLIPIIYVLVRWVIERRFPLYWFKAMLITGLISAPPAIYNVLLTRLNPTWEQVLAQFANAGVYTPNLLHYFILLGLPLILAVLTAVGLIVHWMRAGGSEARETPALLFLLTWFFAGWALTYVPTDFQIHMINSWQVPLVLLAGLGFFRWILPWLQKWFRSGRSTTWAAVVLIGFCGLTNLYLFAWRFYDLHRYDYPFYLHRDEVTALGWLEQNTPPDAVILSSLEEGQYIPGISGRRAFLAHWAQTLDYYHKQELVAAFFNPGTPDTDRWKTLDQFQVDYVLAGPAEQALGGYDPGSSTFLKRVFTSGQVEIYQVVR